MLPAQSYEEVCSSLRAYMSASGRNRGVKLVGLIFCQPHTKFSKDEILPGLRYFHYRSGERVNFYFPGYGEGFEAKPGEIMAVPPADGPGWVFNAQTFEQFR